MKRVRKILIAGLLAAAATMSAATPAISSPAQGCINTYPGNGCRPILVIGPFGIPELIWSCPNCPGDM